MRPTVVYAVRSHVGKQRENNEDNLFANGVVRPLNSGNRPFSLDGVAEAPSIFAVCDGMGGEEAGETASFLAVQTLLTDRGQIQKAPPQQMRQAVQAYADRVHKIIQEGGKRSGATLALAVVSAESIFCFNLGDSRIYLWQADRLRQITNDHTAAVEGLRRGLPLSEQECSDFRLTRCVGIGSSRTVEAYPAFRLNGWLLLCSDGLTDLVDPQEMEQILRTAPQVSGAADGLVQAALRHGGGDNVTVIVAQIRRRGLFHF